MRGNRKKNWETCIKRKNLGEIKEFHFSTSSQHLSEQSLTRNQNGAAEFTHRELVTASGPRVPQTIVLMKGPGATTGGLGHHLERTRVHVYPASAPEPRRKVFPIWTVVPFQLSLLHEQPGCRDTFRHFQDLGPLLVEASSGAASRGHGAGQEGELQGPLSLLKGHRSWSLSWSQIGVLGV